MKKFDKTFGATRQGLRQGGRRPDRWTTSSGAAATAGTSCSSRACGSRTCSTTTSAAPSAASSRTRRRKGEICFCAYNTGIGWRNIIEKMHMTATLTKWYEEHGRHEIFAGNKAVPLESVEHSLVLDPEAVAAGKQTDLDEKGIAKTAREEKVRRATRRSRSAPRTSGWPQLYRQHVLKEEPAPPTGCRFRASAARRRKRSRLRSARAKGWRPGAGDQRPEAGSDTRAARETSRAAFPLYRGAVRRPSRDRRHSVRPDPVVGLLGAVETPAGRPRRVQPVERLAERLRPGRAREGRAEVAAARRRRARRAPARRTTACRSAPPGRATGG